MFKSFKKLSALLLGGALLAVGCATEGDIHKLNERIDALITGKVATIETQIKVLNETTLPALETALKGDLATAKENLEKEITALKKADTDLGTSLNTAVTNLNNAIAANTKAISDNKAAGESALASAKAELTQAINDAKKEASDAFTDVNSKIQALQLADSELGGRITNLQTEMNGKFDNVNTAIRAAEAAAVAGDKLLDEKKADKTQVATDIDAAKAQLRGEIDAAKEACKQYTDGVKDDLQAQINTKANKADVDKAFADLEAAYKAADDLLRASIETLDQNKLDKATFEAAKKALEDAIDKVAADAAANLSAAVAEINNTIAQATAAFTSEIGRLEGRLKAAEDAIDTINEETIPAVKKQIEDLEALCAETYVTNEAFSAYKDATKSTLDVMQASIDALTALTAGFPEDTTIKEYIDAVDAKLDDYVLKTTFDAFVNIAATKEELSAAKDAIEARIQGVEAAYKAADDALKATLEREFAEADDALEIIITAAYKQAIKELADNVKETTDKLAQDITDLQEKDAEFEQAINSLNDAIYNEETGILAKIQLANNRIDDLDAKIDTEVGRLEGVIEDTAAQTLADAKAYTDEEVGKVWDEIDDIWDAIYFIEDMFESLSNGRLIMDEAAILALARRVQSVTYVPDYDDMKITMNVAYVKNGEDVAPVPQKTKVTYKILPVDMADAFVGLYEEILEEEGEDEAINALETFFYFDVTNKLKTRSTDSILDGRWIQIEGIADYDPICGYITFEVLPIGIVNAGFVASDLVPKYIYYSSDVHYRYQPGQNPQDPDATATVAWVDYLEGYDGVDQVTGDHIQFPVYEAADLETYRARDCYAMALEFLQYDTSYDEEDYYAPNDVHVGLFDENYRIVDVQARASYWLIDWDACELLWDYTWDSADYEAANNVSSCYNILHPSTLAESPVVEILRDPFVKNPDDPRADEQGWVNMQDEMQKLAYNTPTESVDEEHPENNSPKVMLENARPLVAVEGVKYTYDELWEVLGIALDAPTVTDTEYTYEQGDATSEVNEDNFTEGTKEGQFEAEEYLTIAMSSNDDSSLAEKKLAVGNVITGTYTWTPAFGDPFEWYSHVKITKDQYVTTATAHIDWTYALDADQDHENFYNRRDEDGKVPVDGYYRRDEEGHPVEIILAEGVVAELAEKYGIESLDELFNGQDPIQFTGYTVTEGSDVEYANGDEDEKAVFSGLRLTDDGKIVVSVENFEFIQPREPGKTYTVTASFETSYIEFTVVLTLTTTDRDRTPIVLSLGETAVKLNDEDFYNVDADFFTAESADKAAELLAKFIAQGIVTADDFADAAAFIDDQTGEVRNSPIDRLPGTDPQADAWYEIYKVFAQTLDGQLTSELLKEIMDQKQEESRYTYIGQEVQFDWTVKVDLPGYDYLHLHFYTFNTEHAKANFIQKWNFKDNDGSILWWTQVNPSYFVDIVDGQQAAEPADRISFRHALADYDVAYINLAELAFNIVDEDDKVMDEAAIEEAQLIAEFVYTDPTQGAKDLPAVDQINDILTYANLWMDPTVFYYRTNEKKFIPVKGTLAIKSGNTDVLFELPTRFDTPKASVDFPDEMLDYSKYAVVRWTPFKEPVAQGYTIVLDENMIYRVPLFKGMFLEDNRPNGTSYYVINDGEWVMGNVTAEFDADGNCTSYTAPEGETPNGYAAEVRADQAYHITTTFTYNELALEPSLRKLLSVQYFDGESYLTKEEFDTLSEDAQAACIPYIVYDYRSEVEFRGKVDMDCTVQLENPWQETLKFKYVITIKGVNYQEPAEEEPAAEEPAEPVEP